MNDRDFIYWLQGFLEIADPNTLTAKQVQIIKDHLSLVLEKITPPACTSIEERSQPGIVNVVDTSIGNITLTDNSESTRRVLTNRKVDPYQILLTKEVKL